MSELIAHTVLVVEKEKEREETKVTSRTPI